MAQIRTKGIIIRQTDYGEGHRMLSIFTEDCGIVKAVSYGAGKSRSKAAASGQFLCWADFELHSKVNSDIMTVRSADTIDAFLPVTEDIKKLSLCAYLADITYGILGSGNPDIRLLHIFLNCVYALAYKNEDMAKVKAVYELKMMCAEGYMPSLTGCASCGEGEPYAFDLERGGTVCKKCGGKNTVRLDGALYRALSYIVSSEDKKMLSFTASDDLTERLGSLAERYVLTQLDINPKSLAYYKTMLKI